MNSRERVITALNHEEPDRVPIDLGGTAVSTIALPTYAALRRHLGLPEQPIQTLELVQQVARVDEDVMDRHGRTWLADDHVVAQCCHFTGRSPEPFLAGVDCGELLLERGSAIESEAFCRLV